MKQKHVSRTLTVAVLTLVATMAYAQDKGLIANIPFGFRVNGSDLPAGRYKIARKSGSVGGNAPLVLQNLDDGKTIFLPAKVPMTERTSNGKDARLIFHCLGDGGCALETMWTGTGSGFEFPVPALTAAQKERHETIYLDVFKDK